MGKLFNVLGIVIETKYIEWLLEKLFVVTFLYIFL